MPPLNCRLRCNKLQTLTLPVKSEMRNQGKIAYWNEDKGYGFIQPETDTKQVFVHIRAYSKHAERPAVEDKVSYALSTDKQGRPCAVKVKKAGEKQPAKNYSGYSRRKQNSVLCFG